MAVMTERMQELFNKVTTAVLSTATGNGIPNAVPINAKKILDEETILISDQYFSKTLANMKANPQVSVTYWQGLEGYQLKGTVRVETSGPLYEEAARWVDDYAARMKVSLKSKGAIILKVEEIYSVAPGLDAGKRLA